MELWIRTQNKGDLLKIHNITIDSRRNLLLGNLISNDNASICDYWELGRYKTTKRALEILDEIQSKIVNTINIPSDISDVSKQIYIPPFMIYEMPKE